MKEKIKRAILAILDPKGREQIDPHPLRVDLGLPQKPSLEDRIAAVLKSREWDERMNAIGEETLEEASDFDVDEDEMPLSQYEFTEMQEEILSDELNRGARELIKDDSVDPAPTNPSVDQPSDPVENDPDPDK